MEIFDCEQNSDAWFAARLGIPTASKFSQVLAKGEGKTRRTYMLKLAGEIITGKPMSEYSNAAMERGKEMEAEARSLYGFITNAEMTAVGFIRNGPKGCSPDRLVGADGLLEIKTAEAHILIDKILASTFPPEHAAQVQGQLWVTEREWCDLAIYWPGLPLFRIRAHRDARKISEISNAVDAFNDELAETVVKVRRYSGAPKEDLRRVLRESVNAQA